MRGLVIHFLNLGTVEQAVAEGREAGVPDSVLRTLPGMTFHLTSAAGAILSGRSHAEVFAELWDRVPRSEDAEISREELESSLRFVLEFLRSLGDPDAPIPALDGHWYDYGPTVAESRSSPPTR